MAVAWWMAKHRIYDDNRLDLPLAKTMADDEFDFTISVESMFDNLDDELMDRDMEFYEANEIARRLTDLSYGMVELVPLMTKTFNVALLTGVDFNAAGFVGIEKSGTYPVMFVE